MKKIFLILATIVLGITVSLAQSFKAPLEARFYANKLKVYEGEKLTFNLYVYPDGNSRVVTVSNDLYYAPSYLSFVSSSISDGWIELRTPGEHTTDTKSGLIRRTAGFPNGLVQPGKYITYEFLAKQPGVTKLQVQGRMAIDIDGNNIGLMNKVMEITILPKKKAVPIPVVETKMFEADEAPDAVKEVSTTTPTVPEPVVIPSPIVVDLNMDADGRIAILEGDDYSLKVTIDRNSNEGDAFYGNIDVNVTDSSGNTVYEKVASFSNRDAYKEFLIPSTLIPVGEYDILTKMEYVNSSTTVTKAKLLGVVERPAITFFDYTSIGIFASLLIVILAMLYHIFHDHAVIARLREKGDQHNDIFVKHKK